MNHHMLVVFRSSLSQEHLHKLSWVAVLKFDVNFLFSIRTFSYFFVENFNIIFITFHLATLTSVFRYFKNSKKFIYDKRKEL